MTREPSRLTLDSPESPANPLTRAALPLTLFALLAGCGDGLEESFSGSFGGGSANDEANDEAGPEDSLGEEEGPGEDESPNEDDEADESEDEGPKLDLGPLPDGEEPELPAGIPEDCTTAAMVESAVGCEFYAVDLNNSNDDAAWGIAVSNVQEQVEAEVVLEQRVGGTWQTIAGPELVAPLGSHLFTPPQLDQDESIVLEGGAFRVRTDVPTMAYEFNPVDGWLSFSSDAALLYPVSSWDYLYDVVSHETEDGWEAFTVIMAAHDGTVVNVTPSVPTLPGPGVPTGIPGQTFQLQLDAGDMAQIAISTLQDQTMLGTRLESDEAHPIGVFTGNECAWTGNGACDHIAEMITGLHQWGLEFVASRMPTREAVPEATYWTVYASEDDTTISFDAAPGITGLPDAPITLDQGQFMELQVTGPVEDPGDFMVQADKPIALVSLLIGIESQTGDPAMLQLGPIEQYLPRYVVYVPETWDNDYLVLSRLAGAQVLVDGAPVPESEFIPVGAGDYEVARILTTDGVHIVDGDGDPVSVSVVGFDGADSYAYLGGVGTQIINRFPPVG